MRRTAPLLALIAALGALSSPARAAVPEVVTDTPVVQALVSGIMGDLGKPVLLLDRGADAHDFQLRPSQVRALGGAGLVVWIGPAFTPWLDRAIGPDGAANSLVLLDVPGTALRAAGAHEPAEDGPTDEGHDHGPVDPHAWLDPDNGALWLSAIADALAARDPGNATTYRANATLLLEQLRDFDRSLAAQLKTARAMRFVTAHDSLGYFAGHYGLSLAGALAEGDAAAPGAAHLAELRAAIEAGEIDCVFPEAMRDQGPVVALTDGTPVRVGAPLDPEGRELAADALSYQALLGSLATAIADCAAGR